jgi:hypothetical protein
VKHADVFSEAVAAIDPPADRLKEARGAVAGAVESLQDLKQLLDDARPAGEVKELLNAFADALLKVRVAGRALPKIMRPNEFLRTVRGQRGAVKNYAVALQVPTGSKRFDPIKNHAKDLAHEILVAFGKRPAKTRRGAWNRLANALFTLATDGRADLFGYLRISSIPPLYSTLPR